MSSPSSSNPSALQVLRTAQHHHVTMGAMADQKASFLLAGALVTLAVVLPQTLGEPKSWTLVMLALTALSVAVTSVLALTPRMLVLSESDSNPELNLLFCGHFTDLGEEEYVGKLRVALETDQAAQDALARDLFQMGLVLHQKKFRHLAAAYTVCIVGLIATAITWFLSLLHLL